MSIADPNKTILTGENPFIRLSLKDGDPNSTDASYWRIIFSAAGPGHVLYLKSELTEGRWPSIPTTSRWRAGCRRLYKACSMPNFPTQRSPVRRRRFPRLEIPATSGLNTSSRTRRHLAHLVRYRRAAAHPLAAEPDPQPALRRMHCIDTGARHAPRPQRH